MLSIYALHAPSLKYSPCVHSAAFECSIAVEKDNLGGYPTYTSFSPMLFHNEEEKKIKKKNQVNITVLI